MMLYIILIHFSSWVQKSFCSVMWLVCIAIFGNYWINQLYFVEHLINWLRNERYAREENPEYICLYLALFVYCKQVTIAIKQSCYPYSQIVSLESHVTVLFKTFFARLWVHIRAFQISFQNSSKCFYSSVICKILTKTWVILWLCI